MSAVWLESGTVDDDDVGHGTSASAPFSANH